MNESTPDATQESNDEVTEANVLAAIKAVTKQVRDLTVAITDGQVTIGGTAPRYHDKQQAQNAAMDFLRERKRLVNGITVPPTDQ